MGIVVTTGQSAPGPAGPTGATGNGAVYQSLDALSDDPRGVADWGPIINTAVAAGTQRFVCGPFDYPISTALALDSPHLLGPVFEGAAGLVYPNESEVNQPVTRFIWQGGSGSGPMILGAGSTALCFRDIALVYVHTSGYDGDLVSFAGSIGSNASSLQRFTRCYFGMDLITAASADRTAHCLVNLTTAVCPKFDQCSFGGAQSLVRGPDSVALNDYSTDVSFVDCLFEGWIVASVMNVALPWNFTRCTWEGLPSWAFDTDIGESGSPLQSKLVLDDCWFWDASVEGVGIVNQQVGQQFIELDVRSGFFNAQNDSIVFALNGPANLIKISGGEWVYNGGGEGPFIDLGSSSTAFKRRVEIDIDINSSGQYVTNVAGHGNVDIKIPYTSNSSFQKTRMQTRMGYERFEYPTQNPTVAVASGAPGTVLSAGLAGKSNTQYCGTDLAGIIKCSCNGAVSGEIITVTFSTPLLPHGGAPAYVKPIVLLTPVVISDDVSFGDETTAIAPSNVYAIVANESSSTGSTGFSIGVNGSTTIDGAVAWAYRVIEG